MKRILSHAHFLGFRSARPAAGIYVGRVVSGLRFLFINSFCRDVIE
ncbi:MAG: hypothetical protein GX244_10980 [Firmicutes bacterium]|nr:hypothetical protein [Bacillota bacterium]